jgi:hypothetical protein
MSADLPNALKSLLAEGAKPTANQWWECADALLATHSNRDDAAENLRKLFRREEEARPYLSSYRSKILTLAFPKNRRELVRANQAKIPTNDLLKIARHSARFVNGKVVKATSDPRGGHNRRSSADALTQRLIIAFEKARDGGLNASDARKVTLKCIERAFDQ